MNLHRWKFPDLISRPIAVHHYEKTPEGTNPDDAAMLRIADSLAHIIDDEEENDHALNNIHDADLKILGIDGNGLNDMQEYLFRSMDGVMAFFNAMT